MSDILKRDVKHLGEFSCNSACLTALSQFGGRSFSTTRSAGSSRSPRRWTLSYSKSIADADAQRAVTVARVDRPLVYAKWVEPRMQRLTEVNQRLDEVRQAGEDAYLADEQMRAATERWLQVAVQICIDLGMQLAAEKSAGPRSDDSEVFRTLGERGVIPKVTSSPQFGLPSQRPSSFSSPVYHPV